jgi:hypothetical protein
VCFHTCITFTLFIYALYCPVHPCYLAALVNKGVIVTGREVTLLDSLRKRCDFVNATIKKLGTSPSPVPNCTFATVSLIRWAAHSSSAPPLFYLASGVKNVSVVWSRAEDSGKDEVHREVAPLSTSFLSRGRQSITIAGNAAMGQEHLRRQLLLIVMQLTRRVAFAVGDGALYAELA